MRHVLFIAYFFPPAGGAGVQRSTKFVKYLPQFGWQPHVLTVREGCYFALDPTLSSDIPPDVEVVRSHSWEIERLQGLRRLRRQHSHSAPTTAATEWLAYARRYIIPDPQIGWWPHAVGAARNMLKRTQMAAVFSTSSPATAHLIAMAVQARSKLPWLADFRDAWSDDAMGLLQNHRVHAALELQVLRRANRVVGVTQPLVNFLRQRAPHPHRYEVITNGFDPADFPAAPQRLPKWPWTLTFSGTVYAKISTRPFLEGLHQFLLRRPDARTQVCVRWIGQMDRHRAAEYEQVVQQLNLQTISTREAYVPHAQSIAALQHAHVLIFPLYAGAAAAQVMSGKIFEYLAAQRPILAMVDAGVARQLLQQVAAGPIVHPSNVGAIADALQQLFNSHENDQKFLGRPQIIAPYSRINTAAQLAHTLDTMVQSS